LEIVGFLAWMEFQVQRECREIQGCQEFQDMQEGKEKKVCLVLVEQVESLVFLVLRAQKVNVVTPFLLVWV